MPTSPRSPGPSRLAINSLFPALGLTLLAMSYGTEAARRSPHVPILMAPAEQRSVPYKIEATRTVEPIQTADLTAQVGGLVTQIYFREGDEVAAGQSLFQIDPQVFEAAAERAAAVLARDRAQAETARLDLV